MKILLVNKFHWNKGGSEKYYFELGKLLKEHGHEVAYFSMEDEKNIKTGDKEYFVKSLDLNKGSKLKAFDIIYSKDNYKKMIEAIEDFAPDIVHLNNFQRQLSSSVVKAAYDKKIPIVFTMHDLQAVCPAISMIDSKKNVCDRCVKGKYLNCVIKKCNKNSLLKSIIGAIEGYYYRANRIYLDKIDTIITPTEFYRQLLINDGIDQNKVICIHNFVNINQYDIKKEDKKEKEECYAFFSGRLSKEKGILNLLQAFQKVENGKLYIAGDGPETESIKQYIADNKLQGKIVLLGFLNSDNLKEYIARSKFIIVPSIWYENGSYAAIEASIMRKAVIASDIGGIPEVIVNNKSGLLFEYNNINDLTDKINLFFNEDEEALRKYGEFGRKHIKEQFDSEKHYNSLIEVYKKIKKEN